MKLLPEEAEFESCSCFCLWLRWTRRVLKTPKTTWFDPVGLKVKLCLVPIMSHILLFVVASFNVSVAQQKQFVVPSVLLIRFSENPTSGLGETWRQPPEVVKSLCRLLFPVRSNKFGAFIGSRVVTVRWHLHTLYNFTFSWFDIVKCWIFLMFFILETNKQRSEPDIWVKWSFLWHLLLVKVKKKSFSQVIPQWPECFCEHDNSEMWSCFSCQKSFVL